MVERRGAEQEKDEGSIMRDEWLLDKRAEGAAKPETSLSVCQCVSIHINLTIFSCILVNRYSM